MPKIIYGDPGHGGKEQGVFDPGAVGNNLRECDLTLDICQRIKAHLESYDVEFRIGPQGSLFDRIKLANELKADFFLSIHINAGGGTGFESFVYTEASGVTHQFQDIIHGAIVSGFLADQSIVDRGRKQANFYVLRETNMPAVLLECLFIDNEQDATLLGFGLFLDGLANEIAYGLVKALGLQCKVSQPVPPRDVLSMAGTASKVTIKAGGKTFPAIMVDGKTYGPIRDVAEALGHRVTWYEEDKLVHII